MLSANERQLLLSMSSLQEGYAYYFKTLAEYSGLDLKLIRRTVRSLARKGYTIYVRGLMDEDGRVCGAGYGLTHEGRKYIEENFLDLGNPV